MACVLGLAGCGGDASGAAVLPTRGTPTSVVASPTPSLTTAQIAAEAVAFVRSYYAEINHAIATGDTTQLRAMQKPTCACTRITRKVEETWASGRVVGETFFVVRTTKPFDVYPGVVSVKVDYDGRAYRVVDKAGRITSKVRARSGSEEVEVVREGARWAVSDVRLLSS